MEIPIPMHTYSINRMSDHTRNMSVSVEFLMWLWRRVHIPSYLLSGASPSAAFREPRLAFPGTQAYPVIWFDFPEPMTFGSTQGTDFFAFGRRIVTDAAFCYMLAWKYVSWEVHTREIRVSGRWQTAGRVSPALNRRTCDPARSMVIT